MIEVGTNATASMIASTVHGYRVVLSVIRLPHLPVSRQVLAKLHGKEIVGEFGRPPELSDDRKWRPEYRHRLTDINLARAGMKISRVEVEYKDGAQVITGWVRSIGPRPNLESFLREFKPDTLAFAMRGLENEAADYPGALEISRIVTWDLVPPPKE